LPENVKPPFLTNEHCFTTSELFGAPPTLHITSPLRRRISNLSSMLTTSSTALIRDSCI
jgi:hypothetical protein